MPKWKSDPMRATNETRKPTATPNGKTAGKTATKNMNTATRIDRWRRLAEERIARLDELHCSGLALLRTCAEIEGMTPVDLIVDRLTRARAGGKIIEECPKDCCSAEFNAFIDTDYELNTPTRTRNNHEREIVNDMEFSFTYLGISDDVLNGRGAAFLRCYYRRGDVGLHPAVDRMTADALARLEA